MGRPPAKLSPDVVPEVLGYLKAAALRTPEAFQAAARSAETRVALVAREVAEAPAESRHLVLGEWVLKHVTAEGRTRMFAALRRRRADAKAAGKPKKASLGLSAEDAKELQALAVRLEMPATRVVRTLVAIAAADKDLRSQMVRLGVAMKAGELRDTRD
jgi:hypothetical protein